MLKNMGSTDRILRIAGAATLALLALATDLLPGPVGWLALGVAAVFTLTALVGLCPLYRLFGIKTCKHC